MFTKNYSKILFFFQFYGTLAQKGKISMFVTIFWLTFGSGFYVWWSVELDMLAVDWIVKMSDVMYYGSYCLILLTEWANLISNLLKMKTVEQIFESFSSIDEDILNLVGFKINYGKSRRKLYRKILFLVVVTFSVSCLSMIGYIDDPNVIREILNNLVIFHMVHITSINFIFFVDLLNERLGLLNQILAHNKEALVDANKIHTKIFQLSRLINEYFGVIISLNIYFHCMIVATGFYMVFLNASGIDKQYSLFGIC
jgi:hypothetical protein